MPSLQKFLSLQKIMLHLCFIETIIFNTPRTPLLIFIEWLFVNMKLLFRWKFYLRTSNLWYNSVEVSVSLLLPLYSTLLIDLEFASESNANVSRHFIATPSNASMIWSVIVGSKRTTFFNFATCVFVFFGTFVLMRRMRRGIIGITSGASSLLGGVCIEIIWRFL